MIIDLFVICAWFHDFLMLILELDLVEVDEIRSHEVSLDIDLKNEKIGVHIFNPNFTEHDENKYDSI